MKKIFFVLLAVMFIHGCVAPTNVYHSSVAQPAPLNPKVLILPPDVVISKLNAGGTTEPVAEWSQDVTETLESVLAEKFYEQGVQFIPYGYTEIQDEHVDVIRQANVMMDAVELAQVREGIGASRNYALGKGSLESLDGYPADYLMITVVRGNVATGGRVGVALLGAIAGVTVEMNSTQFRVGVFDLRDGQLKWANFDNDALAEVGNLVNANEDRWSNAVDHLLTEFPL